jgi:hypothetical protein
MIVQYFSNIFRALDQLLNALLAGDPRETVSSRMGKAIDEGRCMACRWACRILSLFDQRHCQTSIDPSVGSMAVGKD